MVQSKSELLQQYDTILTQNHNPGQLQVCCEAQRSERDAAFRARMISPDFSGVLPDEMLIKSMKDSAFIDPRNNLCIWARPTSAIRELVLELQKEILKIAPNLWLMPLDRLHMTALEILHSATPEIIAGCIEKMAPFLPDLMDLPRVHKCRLVRPILNVDNVAIALTFVPAAENSDAYSYIHLRRDFLEMCERNGVEVVPRYATVSSHLTIARFVENGDVAGEESMKNYLEKIDKLNEWIKERCWGETGGEKLEWWVGQERGIELRKNQLWYGGGESEVTADGY